MCLWGLVKVQVVDIGDNQAVVFKVESHNHPSAIEPYQGLQALVESFVTLSLLG